MKYFNFALSLLILFSAPSLATGATAIEKIVPVELDFPMLQSIITFHYFIEPGKSTTVLDEGDGCRKIVLAEPEISESYGMVRTRLKVTAKVGATIMDSCVGQVSWHGYIEADQKIWFDKTDNHIRFITRDSRFLDADGKVMEYTGLLYSLVKKHVHKKIDQFSINLTTPVNELKAFIIPLFPERLKERGRAMAKSIKPVSIVVLKDRVLANLSIRIPDVAEKKTASPGKLDKEELSRFIKRWESSDAFLVQQIMAAGESDLSEDERDDIFSVLLETRTRFMQAVSSEDGEPHDRLVRKLFIRSWEELAPILKKHLKAQSSSMAMRYLALFTAGDTLRILDSVGPALGIELSRDGLIRLARLLDKDGEWQQLKYDMQVNQSLRSAIGLSPEPPQSSIDINHEEIDLPDPVYKQLEKEELYESWLDFFLGTAYASKNPDINIATELSGWIATRQNLESYLTRLFALLSSAGDKVMEKSDLPEIYHPLFNKIIKAIAWQESCFRQFRVHKKKIVYLRSYNKTSVGLMQIHEKVWRGIYSPKSLRWDIAYNAEAGAEITELYLHRYTIKRMERLIKKGKLGAPYEPAIIAKLVYAQYNGGPKHFWRYQRRAKRKKLYRSDKLFAQKWKWVSNNSLEKVSGCLGGL